MRFLRASLAAPSRRLAALADFYGSRLGFRVTASDDKLSIEAGETELEFVAAAGEPFYHFALLVPGNRFDAALDWARATTELLRSEGSGEVVFDFDAWNAQACYFHDPALNVVELIAHHGVDEADTQSEFRVDEIVGVSELGLVGDTRSMAESVTHTLGLELWDGTLDVPGSLAFVGEKARTLILAPEGRGWLPTGRPARPYQADVLLTGERDGEVDLEGSHYRVRASAT